MTKSQKGWKKAVHKQFSDKVVQYRESKTVLGTVIEFRFVGEKQISKAPVAYFDKLFRTIN